jgi:hypothetical protein
MKWIRAIDLEHWADTIGSRTQLSEIVKALIRGSADDIGAFRFPTGDYAQIPGFDGRLSAKGVNPYVPDGESVWEFGTGIDYLEKANKDFEERSNNPQGAIPSETTFVFVTPRTWKISKKSPKNGTKRTSKKVFKKTAQRNSKQSLEEWQREKTKTGPWKEVRVIDGIALEDWLDRTPAVAAWVAREVLRIAPQNGARSIEEFWEEFASRFKPSLSEEVLLCGREDEINKLLQQFSESRQATLWLADSHEEAIAVAVAAIRKMAPEKRKYLESRTLVIDNEEAARYFSKATNMIFLVRAGAIGLSGTLALRNPTLVPTGRDDSRAQNAIILKRPTSFALGEALKGMGFSPEKANQFARMSGRSVTILARLISSATAAKPEWDGQSDLLPALLAGGWNAQSEEDRQIVQTLSGVKEYESYEATIRKYLRMQDPPLEKEGSIWKVRAPVDAFAHLGYLIVNSHIERLEQAFKTVFTEIDPSLELPPEERAYASLTGKKLKHSSWIRDGLANTLLLFAALGEGAQLDIPEGIQGYVNRLVTELPGLNTDWRVIGSLQHQLPLLMEAATRPLVRALEHLLEGDGKRIRPIFRDTDPLFSSSPHTGLLWALEALAWDPEFLLQASSILAKLARVDPGGKLGNRPINSLREIFLPWHPNTNASVEQRLAVLGRLLQDEPQVGWRLILLLLPESHSVGQNNPSPRFREAGASERSQLTRGLVFKAYEGIINLALTEAKEDAQRWAELVPSIQTFQPSQRDTMYARLARFSTNVDPASQTILWSSLRDLANRHRSFQSAVWSMKGSDLEKLESISASLEPTDSFARFSWLFDDQSPSIRASENEDHFDALNRLREQAVRELYADGNSAAVIAFADSVKYPRFVAYALSRIVDNAADLDSFVTQSLGKSERLDEFAIMLSAEGSRRFESEWQQLILSRSLGGMTTPKQLASLLLAWKDESSTWKFVESLGDEIDRLYWVRKQSWGLRGSRADVEFAARKYLQVGRAVAAIQTVHPKAIEISLDLIFEALDKAVGEINTSPDGISSMLHWELGEIFDALERRSDTPVEEVAKREYAYLSLLESRNKSLSLHRLMATDPSFFVSIICDAFKPASIETVEITEEKQRRGRAGYQLLSKMELIPGTEGSHIDFNKLRQWSAEVRRLAAKHDRAVITDQSIGQILAHAPLDADGAWPHRAVRELIEELKSDHLELGISIARFNMRGGFMKAMYEGGGQERAIAQQARTWAKAMSGWPRTLAMLLEISRSWDRHAQREDERARQDELRFEQ